MREELKNFDCGSGELMVAYIYDEASTAERRSFESHLLDCTACRDEFASIASSRFAVFEWKSEEFANIATPVFSIPNAEQNGRAGVFESMLAGVGRLIGSFGSPAYAAVAVTLLVLAGLGAFVLLRPTDSPSVAEINVDETPAAPSAPANEPANAAVLPTTPSRVQPPESKNLTATNADPADRVAPARVKAAPRPVRAVSPRRSAVAAETRRETAKPAAKAPTLSDFDDADDRSLRLTDLLGEIGSGR